MKLSVTFLLSVVCVFFLLSGCTKDHPSQPGVNQPPRTLLWLFPDSSLAQGNSKQHVRWWGEDPDGTVRGFLLTTGKLHTVGGAISAPDTFAWTWTTFNDTVVAFPLLVRQDTFEVAVRAVDNTFKNYLPQGAIVRFIPSPYWDVNGNGLFDSTDVALPTLPGATDMKGSTLAFPLLNQPPSIVFAQNPNDPSKVMQQPDTTFTVATFSWIGSDPDGDQTIVNYEMALNDTSDHSRWISVTSNIKLITLSVPRSVSDTATSEVGADLYAGTFAVNRHIVGHIDHLKLNAFNTFYIRARDIAGDVSPTIQMPSAGKNWYVKKPGGNVLIVNDYIASDSAAVLSFYSARFAEAGGGRFSNFDVLNVARGLNVQQKQNGQFGALVPPFIDPALISTLQLYDVVFWYTDQFPSLAVAQYPLYQYTHDASHKGKVIFTTMFANAIDPRGALKDFAPIDSVSTVDFNPPPPRLLPAMGDTRVPAGYFLYPDSSDQSDIFPTLRFNSDRSNYSVFLRSIYRRADAKYIYDIQPDVQNPKRYVFTPVLGELKSVASVGQQAWACGAYGAIVSTGDNGATWHVQKSGTALQLNALHFTDGNNGWVIGNNGTILQTLDAGTTWNDRSVLTFENLLGFDIITGTNAVVVGTNGLLIHTTNNGISWNSPDSRTVQNLRSVRFADANTGIAVGDSGTIIKTTDGGVHWNRITDAATRQLNSVYFSDGTTGFAVGAAGIILKTTDAGSTWVLQPSFSASELRSVFFLDASNGWISGPNGLLYSTVNGGLSWSPEASGVTQVGGNGQALNSVVFSNPANGWSVGTGGIVVGTTDGGTSWSFEPNDHINVGVIDGIGFDGKRSFVFVGLPLHVLNGDGTNVKDFLEKVLIDEFGL